MRTSMASIASIALFLLVSACAPSRVEMGAEFGGPPAYYVEVADYYGVPEREVIILRDRNIPEEEIPVIFFIAQRARVTPEAVVDLRLQGESWMDISLHYGLGPDVYYVPATAVAGTPYTQAYSYYQNKPRPEWRSIRLSDADVVNFVNLRFVTEHYGSDAPAVMKMRSEGKSFVRISDEVRSHREAKGKGRGRH